MTADIRYGRRGGGWKPPQTNDHVPASCGCPDRSKAFLDMVGRRCSTCRQFIVATPTNPPRR